MIRSLFDEIEDYVLLSYFPWPCLSVIQTIPVGPSPVLVTLS